VKKLKQPGENISLKTKKSEDPLVMEWLNAQINLMDSLRYLMENEIVQHGVRNLQTFVPVERSSLQLPLAEPSLAAQSQERGSMRGHSVEAAAAALQSMGNQFIAVPSTEPVPFELPQSKEHAPYLANHDESAAAAEDVEFDRNEQNKQLNEQKSPPAIEEEVDDEDVEAWI